VIDQQPHAAQLHRTGETQGCAADPLNGLRGGELQAGGADGTCEFRLVDFMVAAHQHRDLILLDILMEDYLFDGRTFFVQLREVLRDRTPVIIISVLNEDQVDDLKFINDVGYLRKPIEQEELLNAIDAKVG